MLEARRRVEWLATRVPAPASILEIGAATGEFCRTATEAGYRVTGIEPTSAAAVAAEQAPSARILRTTIARADIEDHSVDAVVLFHVLEHLDEPLEALVGIRRWLRPDGWILLEVPNGDSLGARVRGASWAHAVPAEHTTLPTKACLRSWLASAGFSAVKVSRHTMGLYAPNPRSYLLRRLAHRRLVTSRDLLRAVARAR